jgi:excinuclease ABC subunit C
MSKVKKLFLIGSKAISAFVSKCPSSPGVYKMFGQDGSILYVGKANNLKARLSSYVNPRDLSRKTLMLTSQVATIEVSKTANETQALLLESELIKKFKPKYNIMLKDDKSFPYICMTDDHKFPRIMTYRGIQNKARSYFGPFISPKKVHHLISLLQRAFLLRSCTDSFFENTKKPCILYEIKRCSAPCVGKVSSRSYAGLVRQAKSFLDGNSEKLKNQMTFSMKKASKELNYEKAKMYRDRLTALSTIDLSSHKLQLSALELANTSQLKQLQSLFNLPNPIKRIEVYDNSHTQGTNAVGAMVVFDIHGFNTSEYRKYNIKFDGSSSSNIGDDYYMLHEVLSRRVSHADWTGPDLMIIDGGTAHLGIAKNVCAKVLPNAFIISIAKGRDRNSGNETIYTADGRELYFDRTDKLKQFLQVLRDEVHRFAISSHRKKRAKEMVKSSLDEIRGVGVKLKSNLLKSFGSVAAIRAASLEELQRVKGINSKLAESIKQNL